MNIGVIGCGYWGPNLIRNLFVSHRCKTVYCFDAAPQVLQKAVTQFHGLTPTASVDELLSLCDAVMIATPVKSHYTLARQALQSGVALFVEKPLTASVHESLELLALAAQKNLPLMTGHTFLYSPAVQKIREYVNNGALGEIEWLSSSRVNMGKHRNDVNVIWDLAPHDLSMFLYWLGEAPLRIAAKGRACLERGLDVAWVQMEFPSGAVANLELSWLSPVKLRRTTIAGRKKSVCYDDLLSTEKLKLYDSSAEIPSTPNSFGEYQLTYRNGDMISPCLAATEPLQAQTQAFLDWVEKGAVPELNAWISLQVVACLEAATRSLQENGRMVEVGNTAPTQQPALFPALQ